MMNVNQTNGNILLIDDNEQFCIVTSDLIDLNNYKVDYVLSGEEGLQYLHDNHCVDIVILDYDLGTDLNGLGVLKCINTQHPHIQVIMHTAQKKLDVGIECMKNGAFDYLTKPLDHNKLFERINKAMEKRKILFLNSLYFDILVHDLKGPLQNIMLAVESFNSTYCSTDADKKLVSLAKYSNWQILNMIKNILHITRFENHSYTLKYDKVQLKNDILSTMTPLIERIKLSEKQFQFIFNIKEDTVITTDREILMLIINNILWNALRFTGKDDKITVEINRKKDNTIVISIKNTGSYIEDQLRAKIFDKYFQAENPVENKGKNFGLGLTFSKMAIEALEGEIWVDSHKETETTTFYFTIKNRE